MSDTLRPPSDALIARLTDALGPKGVVPLDDGARYLSEPRDRWRGHAGMILRPANTEEVATIVQAAAEERVGVVPYGGGTGLVGGQLMEPNAGPAPLVLSLERMRAVREVSSEDAALTIEAGATLLAAQEAAAAAGMLFPLSYASEGTATIGGALATNAGGVQVLRYGNTRDLTLGIEAVMPDGSVLRDLRPLRKDNTGFNIRHLMIGSEGALGVITAAVLRLLPRPRATTTALVQLSKLTVAVPLLRSLQAALGDQVTAFELMSETGVGFVLKHIEGARWPLEAAPEGWFALIELSSHAPLQEALEETLAAAFEDEMITDAILAQNETQRLDLWRLREEMNSANRMVGAVASHDVALPISRVTAFIETTGAALEQAFPGLRINCFGHLGDGNLHYNTFPPEGEDRAAWKDRAAEVTRITHDQVATYSGSFSAEHGVGRQKPGDLAQYGDPAKVAAIHAIKQALDPLGIMNPGVITPIHGADR